MSALAFTIAGILIGVGVIIAGGVVGGLWFAVSAMRPELLEKTPRTGEPRAGE